VPIISAAIKASKEDAAPILKPVIIQKVEDGSITLLNNFESDAPIDLAAFIRMGSTLFTPLIVLKRIGNQQTQKMIAIFEKMPIPNQRMKTGNNAIGDMGRSISITEFMI